MTFQQKMQALMQDRKHSVVAKRVGVHPITLASYINHGAMPAANIAARIAKSLGVDPGWLIDDARDWPPIRVESPSPPAPLQASAA